MKAKDGGKCKRNSGAGHVVTTKCERKTGQGMTWRHVSMTQDRVDSNKTSQDTWMKTCKIKHMYENMHKTKTNQSSETTGKTTVDTHGTGDTGKHTSGRQG